MESWRGRIRTGMGDAVDWLRPDKLLQQATEYEDEDRDDGTGGGGSLNQDEDLLVVGMVPFSTEPSCREYGCVEIDASVRFW